MALPWMNGAAVDGCSSSRPSVKRIREVNQVIGATCLHRELGSPIHSWQGEQGEAFGLVSLNQQPDEDAQK
jgi:hypothetical protein